MSVINYTPEKSYIELSKKTTEEFADWIIKINQGKDFSPPIHFFYDSFYNLLDKLDERFNAEIVKDLDYDCQNLSKLYYESLQFILLNTTSIPAQRDFEFYDAIIDLLYKRTYLTSEIISKIHHNFSELGNNKRNIQYKLSRLKQKIDIKEIVPYDSAYSEKIFVSLTANYSIAS